MTSYQIFNPISTYRRINALYTRNTAVPLMYWKYTSSQRDVGDITRDDITHTKAEFGDQQADRVSDTIALLLAPESRVG